MVNNNMIMKIATMTISSSNSIPEEIIVEEILKRLPVKSLCRFKTVSKRWLSIINGRPFIDSHFQHSKLNSTRLFGFYKKHTITRHRPIFFSTNYPHTSSINLQDMDYRKWCLSSISPRGLICLYNNRAVQIWNPSTGEHIEVNPKPPCKLRKSFLFLGFDPVSEKHKLLLTLSNGENYVFTLGENNWRKLDNSSSNLTPRVEGADCFTIDGIVYYLGARRDQNDDYELVLVRFDVGSESFLKPIHLPVDLVRYPHDYNYFTSGLYVYRGRILLLNYDTIRTNGYQMWVLEKNKWSPKRLIPCLPPSPVMYYSNGFIDGEELIFCTSLLDGNSEGNLRLCSYDLEKGSSWTETRFPELEKKLDGSAKYEVRFYNYVNTLEPLKSLSIDKNIKKRRSAAIVFMQRCSSFFRRN